MGFQQIVLAQPAPGEAGDFAGANPRASVDMGPGGYVAGPAGCYVGRFVWCDPATGLMDNYYKPNSILGFVHRENQAVITLFLGAQSLIVPGGMPITAQSQGDYWANFAASAAVGSKVYADPVTGLATAAATGNSVTANSTAASLATTGVLTVGATLTGTLAVGQAVYGAGIPAGSYIGSQLTGSAGSTGTYQLANVNAGQVWPVVSSETVYFKGVIETPWTVASAVVADASVTGSIAASTNGPGVLTVTAVGSGALAVGQFISGTGIPANTVILSQITATSPAFPTGGGTGTYEVSTSVVFNSGTIVATAGKVGKVSTWQ